MLSEKLVRAGHVIEIVNKEQPWYGCLLIVDKVKSWGVQASLRTPLPLGGVVIVGELPTLLEWKDFHIVGLAVRHPLYQDCEAEPC
jgi:hypothetical protein